MVPDNVIRSSRAFSVSKSALFRAFSDPSTLAGWWGPRGFTNSFEEFDFKEGGEWVFTMHSPDGTDFSNCSVFEEIVDSSKIVLRHLSKPEFRMAMYFEAAREGSVLTWEMEFENAEMRRGMEKIVVPANEQNFDRLAEALRSA